MAFDSLQRVLTQIKAQDGWQERQRFQRLTECWSDVTGTAIAAQTRPIAIQRQVLYVATASSAWSQTLLFERHHLLEKLNTRLGLSLTDIRFSTAHWRSFPLSPLPTLEATRLWQPLDRPTPSSHPPIPPSPHSSIDPATAFQTWATSLQHQRQHLPHCPTCHCPTPPAELDRWSECALCAAKRFQ